LRLYMAYSNVINKIVLSFIYAIGGVLLVGCLILTLVGDIMTDTIIPALEQSVKPVLEQVIEYAGEFENMSLEEFDEFLAQSDLSREQLKTYGIELEGIEDIQALFGSLAIVSGVVLGFWDQAISFLSTRFYIITIMVAVAYAVAIVAYIFMGKAYKNTSKYLKVLASDPDTNKKAPFITLIIGGAFIAILGIAMLESNVFLGLAKLVESAVIIMLAVLFRQMKRSKPEPIAAAENIEEAPAAEATADEVITENTPAEESTFYEAPAENAPVSEISVDATIEE
ncbi:MAG: hypothetical protein IJC64_01595, partial [Clostridia bacterium]|nr:hypothetical protein [Clostridia bacterium]